MTEIDFVPGLFRCQIEQQYLDFAVEGHAFRLLPLNGNLLIKPHTRLGAINLVLQLIATGIERHF